jgi:hypothetical protein
MISGKIKLGQIYTDGEKFYRVVGYSGLDIAPGDKPHVLVYEEVTMQKKFNGGVGTRVGVSKIKGNLLYPAYVSEFAEKMRKLCPDDQARVKPL